MLLDEISSARYLGFRTPRSWIAARNRGDVPQPDLVRGNRPVEEFWFEDTLARFVKQGNDDQLSKEEMRKRAACV
jgi:hypothetical protein